MKAKKIDNFNIPKTANVQLKITGNIKVIRYMKNKAEPNIKKISTDNYIDLSTGEVKEFNHTAKTRADSKESIKHTFQLLRDTINANVTDPKKCKFLTFTYKENMRDPKRLTQDLSNFYKKLRTYCKKKDIEYPEYITVIEPQNRGAFHAHSIFIYKENAPFIPNQDICDLWKHGFTSTKALKGDCDNIGVYLTAYLTDMDFEEIPDITLLDNVKETDIKTVETTDKNGNKASKAYIKGLRLKMYPKGMQVFRCSKGIVKPTVKECTYQEAIDEIGGSRKTYELSKSMIDEQSEMEINKIKYEHYNSFGCHSKNKRSE